MELWIAATLTACGSIAENAAENLVERAIESEGGGDVDIDFDDAGEGQVNINVEGGEEGDMSLSIGSGEVPDDFPLPIASGGEVLSSSTQTANGETHQGVIIVYPHDDYDAVVELYADHFSGFDEVQHSTNSSADLKSESWYVSSPNVTVSVAQTDEQVTVTASANS